MIVYVLALGLTVAFAWAWERNRKGWLAVLAAVPLTLVAACRWNVGTDFWYMYVPQFRAAETLHGKVVRPECERAFRVAVKRGWRAKEPSKILKHWKRYLNRSEPAHRFLMHAAAASGIGLRPVIALYAVFTSLCVFLAVFRFSRWPSLAAFLYVGTGSYFVSLNVMRQYLAVGICLLALQFVLDRKPLMFLVSIGIASLFHSSAFALLPAYALAHVTLTPRRAGVLVGLALAAAVVARPALMNLLLAVGARRYAGYFKGRFADDGFEFVFFAINLCFLSMGAWYWKRASVRSRWFVLWYGMTAMGTAALALSGVVPLVKRINYYYAAPQFLMLPEMLLAEEKPRRRRILTALVVLAFVAETVVSVCLLNKNGVLPYRWK